MVKADVYCVFDRSQNRLLYLHKIQVKSCISPHNFPISQYVKMSSIQKHIKHKEYPGLPHLRIFECAVLLF